MKSFVLLTICFLAHFYFTDSAKEFKYQECAGVKSIGHVNFFTVSPDPISLSKNITATVDMELNENIPPNAILKIKVQKVITGIFGTKFHLSAPCVRGVVGTCNVEHCKFLNAFKEQACPFFPEGTECDCPFKAGNFGGTNITIPMPQLGALLKFIASGEYRIEMKLVTKVKYTEKVLACYEFTGLAKP